MRTMSSLVRRPVLLALAVLSGVAPAAARPVVVELFTSQSCSSCPPAEALLGQFAEEGGDVLPLAYHVTYFNHLDWRDTYSLPEATRRQEVYAARLGGPVYTPQAVIDGHVGLVGSQAEEVRAAIATAKTAKEAAPAVTDSLDGRSPLVVRIGAGEGAGTVVLVGYDPRHVTSVARGENAGRTLVQANVVRSVAEIGRWTGAEQTLSVPWPSGEAAAILLQDGEGRILAAAATKG